MYARTSIAARPLVRVAATALLLALAAGRGAHAGEDAGGREPGWVASVHFENDLFADTDQQYTNGIKFTLVSPDLTSKFTEREELPLWARRLVPLIPFIRDEGATRTLAFSLGQNMYTPQDTATTELVLDDRPYAGWLYFATTFQTRDPDRQDTVDVQVGVVGPYSYAEQTQDFVHRLRGLSRPRGWSNQLRTEVGVVLAYERVWRTRLLDGGHTADLLTRAGGALGNIAVYGSAGTQLRVGWNLPPDFGYSVIRPGGVTEVESLPSRTRAAAERRSAADQLSLFFFAGVDGRLVGHDLFLDGNTFRSSHSVERDPFVADLFAGVTFGYRGLSLSIANVLRTREFRGQPRDHRFGSITLSYAF